jgi:hypothetical protein
LLVSAGGLVAGSFENIIDTLSDAAGDRGSIGITTETASNSIIDVLVGTLMMQAVREAIDTLDVV